MTTKIRKQMHLEPGQEALLARSLYPALPRGTASLRSALHGAAKLGLVVLQGVAPAVQGRYTEHPIHRHDGRRR